jgi:hypothetical protein
MYFAPFISPMPKSVAGRAVVLSLGEFERWELDDRDAAHLIPLQLFERLCAAMFFA